MKMFIVVDKSFGCVCWKGKEAIVTQQSSFMFGEHHFFRSQIVKFKRIPNMFVLY